MKIKMLFILLMMFCALSSYAENAVIPEGHLSTLEAWLKSAPQYRLANMKDCGCDENIDEIRKGGGAYEPKPNYLPFYAVGNFNGIPSFAVLVVRKKESFDAKILVFPEQGSQPPAVIKYPFATDTSLEYVGLFVKRRKNNVDELLIGTFNSEAETVRIPKMHTK